MFSDSFYPTPFSLCEKMIAPYSSILRDGAIVLEPSAGKWDIASYIKSISNSKAKIHLIEIEPELQELCKKYGTLVAYDFLTFEPDTNYDFIFMNPPYSNGDEHLLKAWDIAKNTTIVCLLNAETIRNPFSAKRKALKAIIEDFGSVEYVENAFSNAERETDVEIAIVTLTKKTADAYRFQNFETDNRSFEELNETSLATHDKIANIVADYRRATDLYADGVAMIRKADSIWKQFAECIDGFQIAGKCYSTNEAVHTYQDSIRMSVWNSIIRGMNIEKYMTGKVLDGFRDKMKQQGNIAVNKQNIELFIASVLQNSGNILEESIVSTFEYLTKYHKENRHEPEWWAHNEAYMVGKKFVLPYIMETNKWDWGFSKLYNYGRVSALEDIDKALCYLTGTQYETCRGIIDSINSAIDSGTTKCQSEFFDIVFYKKWTVHFTFRSPKVWADFNIRATKSLGWLPPDMEWKWRQKNKFT